MEEEKGNEIEDEIASMLSVAGIVENNRKQLMRNQKLASRVVSLLQQTGLDLDGGEIAARGLGTTLVTVASKAGPHWTETTFSFVVSALVDRSIVSPAQIDAAIAFFNARNDPDSFDREEFDHECGVGVVVTEEDVRATIDELVAPNLTQLQEERYTYPLAPLLVETRRRLKWADNKLVKTVFDATIASILGPMTEADVEMEKSKKKSKGKKKASSESKQNEPEPSNVVAPQQTLRDYSGRDLKEARNSDRVVAEHESRIGKRIITRFPPEPNGYLHLGHAKAMQLDFGYSMECGGECILRFDDTNPDAEKQEYIDSIIDNVRWLGYEPARITYSSDYFDSLYELAVKLVEKGLAYVCHQKPEEMRKCREELIPSPYRDRSVEENLRLFSMMKDGMFPEGECTLRVKIDYSHPNPNMRDFVAYRIRYTPHPHTGDKWCIYPTYDYTHCLVDSLEDVTHSLCTLEFENRRESYFWLIDACDMWKPKVWEFSRLNITHNVMSKRKLNRLVTEKFVRGWDDPRMLTLQGLRRRGVPAEAIRKLCETVGITRNENMIHIALFESVLRQELDNSVPRRFAVLDPLRVEIIDFDENEVIQCEAPNHPKIPEMGVRTMPISRILYIDQSDFRLMDDPDFYGLAPQKEVGLRYSFNIRCEEVILDDNGSPSLLRCTHDKEKKTKTRGHIHWVAQPCPGVEPQRSEIRLYETLFSVEEPEAAEDWISVLNPNSERVYPNAVVEPALGGVHIRERFQFERLGFFAVDDDTVEDHPVFNRVVTLRDSFGKKF